jgi:hypothetical protein
MKIRIGVDSTDHIAFFCPRCLIAMKVEKVSTEKVLVNAKTKKYDKCTWIHCECIHHGKMGWRKFYWTVETGDQCVSITK